MSDIKKGKNKKYRFGIRIKVALSLFAFFLVCGIVASYVMKTQIEKRFKNDISDDMVLMWQSANAYSVQLLTANHYNNDEDGFKEIVGLLIKSMNMQRISRVYAFDIDGGAFHNITDSGADPKLFHNRSIFKLLSDARDGKANFIMYREKNDFCEVRFVFPVMVADKIIGVMAFDSDYSDECATNARLVNSTLKIMLLLFISIFVATWFMLGRFLKPLRELSDYSEKLSDAIKHQPDVAFPKMKKKLTKRKDEIGLLSKDYMQVSRTIDRQFKKIEADQSKILELVEDKQSFFNNITHELKTPLTTIMGYTQLISEDTTGDKELLENGMKHIHSESDRLYQMVLQLLEFAKVDNERKLAPVQLSQILLDVISSMQLKLRDKKMDFVVENMSNAKIMGDKNELIQLYTNLIDNAIKYGREETPIIFSIKADYDKVISTVGNVGEPIPEEKLSKLFEPFYRVDKGYSREHGSAGLGLSICKKIMEHHGGEISVSCDESGIICFNMSFSKEGD